MPVIFLLNDTDIPYTMWVYLNGHDMWDHKWNFSEENLHCVRGERSKYVKYNNIRAYELESLTDLEKQEYTKYKDKGGRYTEGVSKKPFCEAVSLDGRKMLSKLTRKWGQLVKDMKRDKFIETWQEIEGNQLLEEKIWAGGRSKRKRKNIDMPPLPILDNNSPRGVVLFPGDEGYEEWVMERDGIDSSSDEEGED